MSQSPLEQPKDPKFEQGNLDFRTDEELDKEILENLKTGKPLDPRQTRRKAELEVQRSAEDREDTAEMYKRW